MAARRRTRTTRSVFVPFMLLAVLVLGIIMLILLARWQKHSPERTKLAATLMEIQTRVVKAKQATAEARESLPPGSPLAPPWDCAAALTGSGNHEGFILTLLATSLLDDPDTIATRTLDNLRSQLAPFRSRDQLTPFMKAVDPESNSTEQIMAHVRDFLCASSELAQIEEGLACGLCADILALAEDSRPLDSKVPCLAARAVAEAGAGNPGKAVDTCVCAYRLTELTGQSRLLDGMLSKADADMTIDRAVWRIADLTPLSAADQERLLTEMDKRRALSSSADAYRFYAAKMESGTMWNRGHGNPIEMFFRGRYGHGSMKLAERFTPLLGQPPYKTKAQLDELRKPFEGQSGRMPPFLRMATAAYIQTAADVNRAEAAHVALALKAWKREHGAYPASLDMLDPKPLDTELLDCNVGKPVQYEVMPEGGFQLNVPFNPSAYPDPRYGRGTRRHRAESAQPNAETQTVTLLWEARN